MPGRHIHRLIYTRIPTSSHQAICIYKTFLFRFCSRKRCFIFIFSLYNLSESPPLAILPMLDDWNLSPDGAGQKSFGLPSSTKTEAGVVCESTYKLRPLTVPENPRFGWCFPYFDSNVSFILFAKRLLTAFLFE